MKLNKAIRVLLFTNSLIIVAGAMLGPIYALFVEKIGGNLLDASYAFGTFAVVAGVVTLISGKYSDKLKENEYIIVVGYLIMAVGFFGYFFVNSVATLLIVQIIIGLGEAIYAPAFDAIYSQHSNGKFGKNWGAWEAMAYFATAIGAIVGGLVVTHFGFNTIFVAMGALSLFSAIYIFLTPRKIL